MEQAIYIADGNKRVGPFETEREALYYFGFVHNTHGQHHEVVNLYSAEDIDYIKSGDGLVVIPTFRAPVRKVLAQARGLIAMEDK